MRILGTVPAGLFGAGVLALWSAGAPGAAQRPRFELRMGDRICLLGNALAERMQHHGWLEARLQSRFPDHQLTVRNLGFSADELSVHQRTMNFGKVSSDDRNMDLPARRFVPWDRYLAHCKADVILAFFGYNESFQGRAGLNRFRQDLERFIDHVAERKYNGHTAPRLVLFSSIPQEDLQDPNLPDGSEHNARIRLYGRAAREVAAAMGVPFVDLYGPMLDAYAASDEPLTLDGIHLKSNGNRVLARVVEHALFGQPKRLEPARLGKLRAAVVAKNRLWFKRYRVPDGYNVYGGRSKIEYPRRKGEQEQISNFRVLQREMDRLDAMVRNRERCIWALARGREIAVDDSNTPPLIPVKTDTPGTGPDGSHVFLQGEQVAGMLTAAKGMRVNLFADETQFPDLVNPVQMAWDTKGRLWVAAWPSYPNWRPDQPMKDKLLIFEDTDGDGRADVSKVFAGDLTNPTGFEFWNGGVLVAAVPDLLFLQDTDGDDKADRRERLLHGISSGDTHHSANSFVLGPGGALYFQEGTFHMSQIESIYGPVRNANACVWRFEPRSFRVERYVPYNFANPHGHVFDRWGQDFVTDGTGNLNYYALPFSGHIDHPRKHGGYFTFFRQRSRPCAATEILSSRHFPPDNQGSYLVANVIGFLGIFQYRIKDDGSGFAADEMEPLVYSRHQNFRPVDIEVGPDGAVYFLDWHNPIIGHLQHHIRDPSRDHSHGRVYRVTCAGRPLLRPAAIDGRPIAELLELLKEPEDRVRYRARIELSERATDRVVAVAKAWVAGLDPSDPELEHHLLEALWLHQQHGRVDRDLLERLLRANDPRARAAATRVLRYMRHRIPDALALMAVQARDSNPRVRLEAVVGASFFDTYEAASVALEALRHPTDRFLVYALGETIKALRPLWQEALRQGRAIAADNPAGIDYLLGRVGPAELRNMPRTATVLTAMLTHQGVGKADRLEAAGLLAGQKGTTQAGEILLAMRGLDQGGKAMATRVLQDLGGLLQQSVPGAGRGLRAAVADLATTGRLLATREASFAALTAIDGSGDAAWALAARSRRGVRAFLGAVPLLESERLRASLYDAIRPLMFALPVELRQGAPGSASETGLSVSLVEPAPPNAKLETLARLAPELTMRSNNFSLALPPLAETDSFGLVYRGTLRVPRNGTYLFFTKSDDGSRLYIGSRLVVDNDGRHGVTQKRGRIRLRAGSHPIAVTYFDSGGNEHLEVLWQGPGIPRQKIPDEALGGAATSTRVAAIRAMAHVPGHEEQKFEDAAKLLAGSATLGPVVEMLQEIPPAKWPPERIRPVVDTIAAHVAGLPATQRIAPDAAAALALGRKLARGLPPAVAGAARRQLDGLGGSIVLIRTVPHKMLYDVKEFWVAAGKPVAIVFQNNDMMPHNVVVAKPGSLDGVGAAADALTSGSDEKSKDYIPDLPEVLWHTNLLYPGTSERLAFVAPASTGDYPFLCTFPGHWRVMNGVMHVVDEVDRAQQVVRRSEEVDSVPMRAFVKDWTMDHLAPSFQAGWESSRSVDNGRRLFTEAGCIKCHTFQGNGATGGPDLTEIGKKYVGKELLRHILEPSAEILEHYHYHFIELKDRTEVIGRIIRENGKQVEVLENLQDSDKVTVVPKDQIEDSTQMDCSPMPTGLLVTLTKEEILDLLVFLQSPGR